MGFYVRKEGQEEEEEGVVLSVLIAPSLDRWRA